MLVIRGGAIGDFILTLPVLRALRDTFPETHLEVLGYPKMAELAMAGGIIDGYRSIEARPLAGFFARNGKLDPELAEYFASFSIIFSYLYDPDEIFQTNVALSSKAQYIQGPYRPDESQETHATKVFLAPLERLAIFDPDPVPRLSIKSSDLPEVNRGKWIAIHPGSGSPKKNWPEENWAGLLERLASETDWNFLLLGGEAEEDRVCRLFQGIPPGRSGMLIGLTLLGVAELLVTTRLFLGHDSGISHLAAALGVPGLLLWGPSKQAIWKPIHPESRILSAGEDLAQLSVDEVYLALAPILDSGSASFAE